jgi:O-antigen/teichoic acid export membrane protein
MWTRLRGHNSLLLAGNLLVMLGGLVASVLTSRALGPESRGDFVIWQAWTLLAAFLCTVGLPSAIVICAPSQKIYSALPFLLHVRLRIFTLLACLAGIFWFLGAPTIVFVSSIFLVLGNSLSAVSLALLQRNKRLGLGYLSMRVIPVLTQVMVVSIMLIVGIRDGAYIFIGMCLGTMLGTVLPAVRLVSFRSLKLPVRFSKQARSLTPINFLNYVQGQYDLLLIGIVSTPAAAAYYSIGSASRQLILAFGSVVGTKAFAREDSHETAQSDAIKSAIAGLTVAVPVIFFSPWVVPFVWGDEYSSAVPVVQILSVSAIFLSVDYIFSTASMRNQRMHALAMLKTIAIVVAVGAILVSGHRGPVVVGLITLASTAISAALGYYIMRPKHD